MPNWCYTSIQIYHNDKDKLKAFFDKVEEWRKKSFKPNDYDKYSLGWLGNIVGNSGLAKWGKRKDGIEDFIPNIRCRGSLQSFELFDSNINIGTETAWGPMLEMWKLLCERYLPGADIYYTADEGGNELYQTNDPDMIGKYYIDIVDDVPEEFDDIAESEYEATEEMVVKFLQRVLHSDETDIKKLLDLLDKSDVQDWVHIHKWETVEINEVISCE
jgi:hypothetical protein